MTGFTAKVATTGFRRGRCHTLDGGLGNDRLLGQDGPDTFQCGAGVRPG